jgi:hypothetical protein
MGRIATLGFAFCLLGAGTVSAQDLPEGTFASSPEGCSKLQTKTVSELGEDLDFQVLTKKGLTAYQQSCDFVNVFGHDATSWVTTAFCDEAGYSYPDLFSIKQKESGKLNVTRSTDLTQQGSDEASSESGAGESGPPPLPDETGNEAAGNEPSGNPAPLPEEQAAESYSTFVKCQTVKP